MGKTTDTITKQFIPGFGQNEDGTSAVPIRAMTKEEEAERTQLNIANTTESRRRAVLEHTSKNNGIYK